MEKVLNILLAWQERLKQDKLRFWIGNLLDTTDELMFRTKYTRAQVKEVLRALFILGYIEIYRRPNTEELPMMSILRICTKPKLNQIDLDEEHRTIENLLALIPEDQMFHSYVELPKDEMSQFDAYCNILYHNYEDEDVIFNDRPKINQREIHDLVSGVTYRSTESAAREIGVPQAYIKACLDVNPRHILVSEGKEYKFYRNSDVIQNIQYEGTMEYNKYQKNGDSTFYANRYKNYALNHPEKRVGEAITGQVFPNQTQAGKAFNICVSGVKAALKDGREIIKWDGTRLLFYYMEEDPTKKVWVHTSQGSGMQNKKKK